MKTVHWSLVAGRAPMQAFLTLLLAVAVGASGCMGAAQSDSPAGPPGGSPAGPPSASPSGSPAGPPTGSPTPSSALGEGSAEGRAAEVFCQKYRAMIDWGIANDGASDGDPYLMEIRRRMIDMRPDAPPFLVASVDVFIDLYTATLEFTDTLDAGPLYELMTLMPDATTKLGDHCNVDPGLLPGPLPDPGGELEP